MRGDIIYQLFGLSEAPKKDVFIRAFRTYAEAQVKIEEIKKKDFYGKNWAERYYP